MKTYAYFHSPIGFIELVSEREALVGVRFVEAPRHAHTPDVVLRETMRQLTGYFSGELRAFDLPIRLQGTPFQLAVWKLLLQIPYGQIRAYKQIAEALGNPKAVRAVGAANGRNPIAIIAPCHRVLASDGSLGGYAGGVWRKAWLLRHEGVLLPD